MCLPRALLLLGNDHNHPFTKTTGALAAACRSLGITPYVRDTAVARALLRLADSAGDSALAQQAREAWSGTLATLLDDAGITAALALDLDWLLDPATVPGHPALRRTFSLWFDDPRTWCTEPTHNTFPLDGEAFQSTVRDPRVTHCFYGAALASEAACFGLTNQVLSPLAAPSSYLHANHPCTAPSRAAFIGNPGSRVKPSREALDALERGADVADLRGIACAEIAALLASGGARWIEGDPGLGKLVLDAAHAKRQAPWVAAVDILRLCGEAHPLAWERLNTSGHMLDAALLVRLVLRYDRPGLVTRLHRAGLCDVYSNPDEWSLYGVQAAPSVTGPALLETYQRHAVHLNAANPIRDATANEKLFEIAACGRVSVNLRSPDVAARYAASEIVLVDTFAEAEAAVRALLADPARALACGKRARLRTAREHTWEHRLRALLALA
jgi:hypothetical protein